MADTDKDLLILGGGGAAGTAAAVAAARKMVNKTTPAPAPVTPAGKPTLAPLNPPDPNLAPFKGPANPPPVVRSNVLPTARSIDTGVPGVEAGPVNPRVPPAAPAQPLALAPKESLTPTIASSNPAVTPKPTLPDVGGGSVPTPQQPRSLVNGNIPYRGAATAAQQPLLESQAAWKAAVAAKKAAAGTTTPLPTTPPSVEPVTPAAKVQAATAEPAVASPAAKVQAATGSPGSPGVVSKVVGGLKTALSNAKTPVYADLADADRYLATAKTLVESKGDPAAAKEKFVNDAFPVSEGSSSAPSPYDEVARIRREGGGAGAQIGGFIQQAVGNVTNPIIDAAVSGGSQVADFGRTLFGGPSVAKPTTPTTPESTATAPTRTPEQSKASLGAAQKLAAATPQDQRYEAAQQGKRIIATQDAVGGNAKFVDNAAAGAGGNSTIATSGSTRIADKAAQPTSQPTPLVTGSQIDPKTGKTVPIMGGNGAVQLSDRTVGPTNQVMGGNVQTGASNTPAPETAFRPVADFATGATKMQTAAGQATPQYETNYAATNANGQTSTIKFTGANQRVGGGTLSAPDQGNGGTIEGNVAALNRQTDALRSRNEAYSGGQGGGGSSPAPTNNNPFALPGDRYGDDKFRQANYESLLSQAGSERGLGGSKRAAAKIAAAEALLNPGKEAMAADAETAKLSAGERLARINNAGEDSRNARSAAAQVAAAERNQQGQKEVAILNQIGGFERDRLKMTGEQQTAKLKSWDENFKAGATLLSKATTGTDKSPPQVAPDKLNRLRAALDHTKLSALYGAETATRLKDGALTAEEAQKMIGVATSWNEDPSSIWNLWTATAQTPEYAKAPVDTQSESK